MDKYKPHFLIFLDIDGVLNNPYFIANDIELAPELVKTFNKTVGELEKKYNVFIVISSAWRIIHPTEFIMFALKHIGLTAYRNELFFRTGRSKSGKRGEEIKAFIESEYGNEFNNFIVIDDETCDIVDYLPYNKIVKTHGHLGYTELTHKNVLENSGIISSIN